MKRKKLIIIISSGVIVLIILGVIIYLSLHSKQTNVAEKNILGEENFEENLVIENVITNEIEENAISEENIVNNEVQESSKTDETTANQDNNQGNAETKQENKPTATSTNVEPNKANSENKDTKAQTSSSSSSNNNNQQTTPKQETKTTTKSETKPTTQPETKKQTQVTSSSPEHMQSWESRTFAQVNKIRKENGSDAITWDSAAYQEALRRAKDNANKDAVIDENGISVYSLNDNETPEGLINKFKSSSGHMQSLKDKKVKKGAVAVYKRHTNLGEKYYGYVSLYEGDENTRKNNYHVDM